MKPTYFLIDLSPLKKIGKKVWRWTDNGWEDQPEPYASHLIWLKDTEIEHTPTGKDLAKFIIEVTVYLEHLRNTKIITKQNYDQRIDSLLQLLP